MMMVDRLELVPRVWWQANQQLLPECHESHVKHQKHQSQAPQIRSRKHEKSNRILKLMSERCNLDLNVAANTALRKVGHLNF